MGDEQIVKYVSSHFGEPSQSMTFVKPNLFWEIKEQIKHNDDIDTIASGMDGDDSDDEFGSARTRIGWISWFGPRADQPFSIVGVSSRWK